MIGAKGFRAREAVANYKRRVRKLVPDDVRAARAALMHGEAVATKPAPSAADIEAAEQAAKEAAEIAAKQAAAEKAAAEVETKAAAEKATKTKKK
ncbi:hypothetical protein [Bradyrhizobium sp. SZCCHNR3118]|uniref:hypothetical protein n=1 Tax=Bradyrhizobium sp. SZCCHNR3118 TaxID=3057468 RepID=UPI002915C488|nr:hypothetical protein [Bradyrhizobium sp. SZCCHNR3118]